MSGYDAARPLADVLADWDDLVARWRLDAVERFALVAGPEVSVAGPVPTYRVLCGEQRIRLVVGLMPSLTAALRTDARVRGWLRTPTPVFAGRDPLSVMSGSPEIMIWLIGNAGALS